MVFSLKKVVKNLKELEELTMQCMKCGICQSVCPLYEKDLLEQSVSRGKISLVEAIFEGRIEQISGVMKYLDYCILCGRCKRFCPSSVKTDEIFVKAKSILRKIEKLPLTQKLILKTAIEKPDLIESLQPLISAGMHIASSKLKNDIRSINFPIKTNIASVKANSFTKLYGGLNRAKNEKMRVIFYPGCAINYIYTSWGEAVVKVLNHYGVSVYVPKKNNCCGIPAATMGEMEIYSKMVNINLDWFDSIDEASYIVTACPTCQWGLSDLGERVTGRKIKQKVIDILLFLNDVLKVKLPAIESESSTLHIPCHYEHSADERMIAFLKENLSKRLTPLDNQSCCGFGGTFSLKHKRDSLEVGKKKIEEINEKRYNVVYTPCPGCVMQLTDLTIEASLDADVRHPIETIYNQLKGKQL